jgi:DNA-binding transcriptional LysR family regulator
LRAERQGMLVRRDHPVAAADTVRLEQVGEQSLLLHRRDTNPGHYDAVLGLYERAGLTPRVLSRELAADLTYALIVDGRAISIAGESEASALPSVLCWVPLAPEVCFDVRLVARRYDRPPALERLLATAIEVAGEFGWLSSAATSR